MKIAVWKTGHEIADTVAEAVAAGLPNADLVDFRKQYYGMIEDYDIHIGYGILRGMDEVFKCAEAHGIPWFHLDRGYFNPGHFGGKYRVSLRGTQQTGNWPEGECRVPMQRWRGFDESKQVLVVPPTDAVREFFNIDKWDGFGSNYYAYGRKTPTHYSDWLLFAISQREVKKMDFVIRRKGDTSALNFLDYNYVKTFNSSLGWQAIQAGVPCVSDPVHSMVGSWYSKIPLENLSEAQYADRHKLFVCMEALQLTLSEMREGKLWPLMEKLLDRPLNSDDRLGLP